MNRFRDRLLKGEVVFGQMVLEMFTSGIGPMLAAAGMEFVIFDMEHGRCDISLVSEMIASCRGSGIVPMARVPDISFAPLSRVLDLGARAVMVPRVETRAQAEEIVRQLKYAPERKRGVAQGFLPATSDAAVHWIRKGFRAISLGSDIGVFLDG